MFFRYRIWRFEAKFSGRSEPGAWIVIRMPENKDQFNPFFFQVFQTFPDQPAAYPFALLAWQDGQRCQDLGGYRLGRSGYIDFCKKYMANDSAILYRGKGKKWGARSDRPSSPLPVRQ